MLSCDVRVLNWDKVTVARHPETLDPFEQILLNVMNDYFRWKLQTSDKPVK